MRRISKVDSFALVRTLACISLSTNPEVFLRSSSRKFSRDCSSACASSMTVPSGSLRTHPVTAFCAAMDRVRARNPTP